MRRVALVAVLWAAMPQIAFAQLAADGTEFVLTIGDGRVLRSPEVLVQPANRDASPGHVNHPDILVCSRNISR